MTALATLSDALAGAPLLALPAAVTWGLASIWLSPCHLAGVPLIVGWLAATPAAASVAPAGSGTPGGPVRVGSGRAGIILAFGIGTLLSLIPLGAAALLLGRLAGDLGFSGNYLAAAFCIFGGLYLLDWLPLPQLGRGLPTPRSRGPWTALLLGLVFGLALGPCAFAWIAPVLGVAGMQAAQGLALPLLLLVLFALGHLAGVLLAAGSLSLVQRWLDALGSNRGLALGRGACGVLLLLVAGVLIDSA
jgi:cytochrome c-type biogenesis protein